MRRNLTAIIAFFITVTFYSNTVSGQITINLPKIKIGKPNKEQPKIKDATTTITTTTNTMEVQSEPRTSNSKLIYTPMQPTNVPVFLKNSIYVQTVVSDEYWKMKGQSNFSSWVPKIRFDQYYNEEKVLNYTVEYFNPDGSAWYSEKLESSGRNAERTVLYESPSPHANGVLDTKSTNGTGVYGFKIINQDTKEVLYQGKFKVGKFSRAYNPQEKNKNGFYVEQDWLLPFGMIGFHHSLDEVGGMQPEVSVWLNGGIATSELEGRIFYKGQQIASTKDEYGGGVSDYDERAAEYAVGFIPQTVWKRYQFTWRKFLVDNNGTFNRDNFPNAHYADKNPGDYTIKIFRSGVQIRELGFTVSAEGKFAVPAYTSQIPMPYYRLILPVKVVGTSEKSNATAWKTDAFYGNPLSGFTVQ